MQLQNYGLRFWFGKYVPHLEPGYFKQTYLWEKCSCSEAWVVLRSLLFRVKMSGNASTFRCLDSGLQGVYKYHGKNQQYPGHSDFFSFVLITLSSTEVTIYHHQKTACWFAFLFLFSSCFTFVCSEMHIFFAGCRIWLSKVRVSGILWVPDIFWDRREAVCLVLIKHSFFSYL